MKFKLPSGVTRAVSRTALKAQKNAPSLLFVGGTVGVVASGVLACRSTLRLEAVLDEASLQRSQAKSIREQNLPNYTEKDYKKDMTVLYVRQAMAVCKLYGPSIVVGAASIAMLAKSHNILTKRNAALSAAYTGLLATFEDYRQRVRDELGEDKDREFFHGKHGETPPARDKNGKKKTVQKAGDGKLSDYQRLFDETNVNWSKNHDYNVVFLRGVQNHMNDQLAAKGHVFLNEVYDALGMEHTPAGAVTGWIYEPKWEDDHQGDGFIDFGIFEDNANTRIRDFCVGLEGGVMLEFNVDGTIWNRI